MAGSSVNGGNGTRTELLARVAGMDKIRRKRPARVLPQATTLIPMETQTPESIGSGCVLSGRKIQPYPLTDDFSQLVLLWQLSLQEAKNRLRWQFPIGVVRRLPFTAF